jgi:hypothetical protein
MLGSFVAMPVGQVGAGLAAAALGPRPAILTAAGLYLVIGAVVLATPAVWQLRRPVSTTA